MGYICEDYSIWFNGAKFYFTASDEEQLFSNDDYIEAMEELQGVWDSSGASYCERAILCLGEPG